MKTAEDTFYEVIKERFPHITKEKFKESLEKSDLLSSALVAMKNYASEALEEASDLNKAISDDPEWLHNLLEGIKERLK